MDLPIEYTDVRDESRPQRDGSVLEVKRYTFYLGKFGPFVERVPLTLDQTAEMQARVAKLRQHLTMVTT